MCQENNVLFVIENNKIFINGILTPSCEAFKLASKYNKPDIMTHVVNYSINLLNTYTIYEAFNLAAEYGHLEILRDFLESGDNNIYNVRQAIILAETNGHYEVTKYLRTYSDYVEREFGDAIRLLILSGQV